MYNYKMNSMFKISLLSFIMALLLVETANAGTSSRRRRKVQRCNEQVNQLMTYQVDCQSIDRKLFIEDYLRNDESLCQQQAGNSPEDQIPQIAQAEKNRLLVLGQCFAGDLSNLEGEEKEFALNLQSQIAHEKEENSERTISTWIIVGVLVTLLLLLF